MMAGQKASNPAGMSESEWVVEMAARWAIVTDCQWAALTEVRLAVLSAGSTALR